MYTATLATTVSRFDAPPRHVEVALIDDDELIAIDIGTVLKPKPGLMSEAGVIRQI